MPSLPVVDFLRKRLKPSIPTGILKPNSVLDLREGEEIVLMYTSTTDKMKFFSAFIRGGLESGDVIWYCYPDEESEIVRNKLRKHGIDVEKHERDGTLQMMSQVEYFMPNGELDFEKTVTVEVNWWNEVRAKGYKHARSLEDLGDFSFCDGQWQKWMTEYWLNPKWDDPNISEWVLPQFERNLGVVMDPFLMEITAINVEHMTEMELNELMEATKAGYIVPAHAYIDLFKFGNSFSESAGLDHEQLVGRKILLEFNPTSDYEKAVDRLAKESLANVEPLFVFTSNASPLHSSLAEKPSIKFFLTSLSTSSPESTSENEVLLPAKNAPLILDAINKTLETYANATVCFVFNILSEMLNAMGPERTFTFLHHALDLLSSEKVTSLFLLNTSAHEPQIVSRIRGLFHNLLTYNKDGMEAVKTS